MTNTTVLEESHDKQSVVNENPAQFSMLPQSEFEKCFSNPHILSQLLEFSDIRSRLCCTSRFLRGLIPELLKFQLLPKVEEWYLASYDYACDPNTPFGTVPNRAHNSWPVYTALEHASSFLQNCKREYEASDVLTFKFIKLGEDGLGSEIGYGFWELIMSIELLIIKHDKIYGHLKIVFFNDKPTPLAPECSIMLTHVGYLAPNDNGFQEMFQKDRTITITEMLHQCSPSLVQWVRSHPLNQPIFEVDDRYLWFFGREKTYRVSINNYPERLSVKMFPSQFGKDNEAKNHFPDKLFVGCAFAQQPFVVNISERFPDMEEEKDCTPLGKCWTQAVKLLLKFDSSPCGYENSPPRKDEIFQRLTDNVNWSGIAKNPLAAIGLNFILC